MNFFFEWNYYFEGVLVFGGIFRIGYFFCINSFGLNYLIDFLFGKYFFGGFVFLVCYLFVVDVNDCVGEVIVGG